MSKGNYKKNLNKPKVKVYKFKDEKVLCFKKRNFVEAGKKVLIEAGEEITKDFYDSLGQKTKAAFCEIIEKAS